MVGTGVAALTERLQDAGSASLYHAVYVCVVLVLARPQLADLCLALNIGSCRTILADDVVCHLFLASACSIVLAVQAESMVSMQTQSSDAGRCDRLHKSSGSIRSMAILQLAIADAEHTYARIRIRQWVGLLEVKIAAVQSQQGCIM